MGRATGVRYIALALTPVTRRPRTHTPARRPADNRTTEVRTIEIRVDKVVAEGDGLGRDADGKVVFVEGALPGELVVARIVSDAKDYSRAETIRIIESNDRRVEPPCPHVIQGCGGCDLQHADSSLQSEVKAAIVRESLARLGGLADAEVRMSAIGGNHSALRTTVRVAAVGDRTGFRKRRSREVVPIDSCLVAHPRINEIIAGLRLAPDSEAVIRVSSTTDESVIWVRSDEDLIRCPMAVVSGPDAIVHETICGVDFRVSASSFFQSSPGAAESVVEAVRRALGPAESWPSGAVVDAYGGVGLIAATVVPAHREIVLIEANPSSCADARHNLAGRRARIVHGRVEEWKAETVAVVIADPARDGLKNAAARVLTGADPGIFVLVSCDPASLGRDSRLLTECGYDLEYAEVLDAFPHTHHVETVSRFVRSGMMAAS